MIANKSPLLKGNIFNALHYRDMPTQLDTGLTLGFEESFLQDRKCGYRIAIL